MTSVLLYFPLTVVGIAVLVDDGAVSLLAVPICAAPGIAVFRSILQASRQHGGPAEGSRHPAPAG